LDFYGFGSLFEAIGKYRLGAPETSEHLDLILAEHLYVEGEIHFRPHAIQVLTNDNELDVAYYIFDDHFLKEHGSVATFLLRESWELPTSSCAGVFSHSEPCTTLPDGTVSSGTVYCSFHAEHGSGGQLSDDVGAWSIPGIRLTDLPRYLASRVPGVDIPLDNSWPSELLLLRSQLLNSQSDVSSEEAALLKALQNDASDNNSWLRYERWCADHGSANMGQILLLRAFGFCARYPVCAMTGGNIDWSSGEKTIGLGKDEIVGFETVQRLNNDPAKSLIQVDSHIAQASIHTDRWGSVDLYNRWILFDDLWAAANADLANAILRYGNRWDVLTVD
jgi:hypothetical protein